MFLLFIGNFGVDGYHLIAVVFLFVQLQLDVLDVLLPW